MGATKKDVRDPWQQTLAESVADGILSEEAAERIDKRHQALQARLQEQSWRHRVIELSGYAGAALFIAGVAAAGSRLWEDVSAALQILLTGTAGVLLGVAAVVIAVRALGGLLSPQQAARRRLVDVLGISAAGLLAVTVLMAIEESGATYGDWLPVVFGTGLLGSALTAWRAPGVLPTLAVLGFTLATVISVLDVVGALETAWFTGAVMVGLGVVGAVGLVRLLPPALLTEGLSLALWVGAAGALANTVEDGAARALGLVFLALATALGSLLFVRGGRWPWAVAAAIALAVATQALFTDTFGAAVAMMLAGAGLIAVSGLLAWSRREAERQDPSRDGAGPEGSAASPVSAAGPRLGATSDTGQG